MKRSGRPSPAPAVVTLVLVAAALVAASVPPSAGAAPVALTGKYLMAFLACNTAMSNCASPQNHVTYLAESNDSIAWSPVPGFRPYPGSVPDVIRRGSTLYLYNPGVLVRFHLDTGAEDSAVNAGLHFGNGTAATFVDPSVFLDSSGTIHLFYLPGIAGQDPAQCPVGQSTCTKHIMSATEAPGSDGGSFLVDSGTRVDFAISGCCFSDPAVFQGPSGYYLYVSEGQAVLAFASGSLVGSYSPVEGLSGATLVSQGTGGVPAGHYDGPSGMFWTFVSKGSTTQVIARASTSSVNSSIGGSSFATVLSGCDFPQLGCSYTVGSPGFHSNTPGVSTTTTSSTSKSTSSSATSSQSTTNVKSTTTTPAFTTSIASSATTSATSRGSETTSISVASAPTQATASSSQSSATSTSGGGGGIPEFPSQLLTASMLAAFLVASYLLARRHWIPSGAAGRS